MCALSQLRVMGRSFAFRADTVRATARFPGEVIHPSRNIVEETDNRARAIGIDLYEVDCCRDDSALQSAVGTERPSSIQTLLLRLCAPEANQPGSPFTDRGREGAVLNAIGYGRSTGRIVGRCRTGAQASWFFSGNMIQRIGGFPLQETGITINFFVDHSDDAPSVMVAWSSLRFPLPNANDPVVTSWRSGMRPVSGSTNIGIAQSPSKSMISEKTRLPCRARVQDLEL
jgi:hypothetical protein